MISTDQIDTISSGNVLDSDGGKVGSVGQVYLDNKTGNPEWVTVKTGMFGGKASFVPLSKATISGEDLHVPYDKAKIKDAPNVDADGELSPQEEDELYRYYGMSGSDGNADAGRTGQNVQAGTTNRGTGRRDADTRGTEVRDTEGHDTSGPNTDNAMTRSEEQARVGTEKVQTGTARLRKYVVTEQQSETVPVSHEEVKVTREPITDANRGDAMAGGELTSEEHEVALHAERATVTKETVPVERVKVGTETVRGEETVDTEVRKEQIEVDDDTDRGGDKKNRR